MEIRNPAKDGEQKGKAEEEEEEDDELNQPKIVLPSSVFPSHVEERVGHLHKGVTQTGLQLNWDPEVMAALDDDFNGDDGDGDELEDDFVALASGGIDCIEDLGAGDEELSTRRFYFTDRRDDDDEGMMFDDSDDSDDDDDDEGRDILLDMKLAKEETRSKFTSYSLSSSVMTRTGGLKTLDDQFEQMFEREYDDKDIGPLDGEQIEGHIPIESDVVTKLSKQYEEAVKLNSGGIDAAIGGLDDGLKQRVIESLNRNEEVEEIHLIDNNPALDEHKWDCESILSTYSNIYNRPKLIDIPRSSEKIQMNTRGIPVEKKGLTKNILKKLEGDFVKADDYAKSVCSRASAVSIARAKDETSEERKTRKKQVKEYRRERRLEKKANASAFKAEECRQKTQEINVRTNLQGIKLL